MKIIIALTLAASILVLAGCSTMTPQMARAQKQTFSSFDMASEHLTGETNYTIDPGAIEFNNFPLDETLKFYQKVSGRTVIRGVLPSATITFNNASPLSRIELLQMLDTVLAQNHIAMVYFGDKGVKAVSSAQAFMERPPEVDLPWQLLPESSSVMCRTVHLKYIIPSETIAVMQPFSSLGNGIIPIDASQTIILRDYSVNIRQQLKLLEELDQKKNVK